VCRELGVPLVVDAAQAMGHLDCAVGAAAIYSSSRKWMAGPRGVGMLAIRPELAQRLRPRLPPPEWGLPIPVMQSLELGEANIAARVGYSVALGEHLAAGPDQIRDRLAEIGRMTRAAVADVRAWLIAERGIVTTYAELQRAPFEMRTPVLRASPHVDTTAEDLDQFAEALAAAVG
jgi:pyridoxal 5-phosphate dependent beta-lyase